jgi:hypothetical protein
MQINVEIAPKLDELERLGTSETEFYAALAVALENLSSREPTDLPGPHEIRINVAGNECLLGDVAVIQVALRSDDQQEWESFSI